MLNSAFQSAEFDVPKRVFFSSIRLFSRIFRNFNLFLIISSYFSPRSTSSSNSSKFTEQSISSLKKRTRSKVQNFLSIRKTDKPPLKTEKPETLAINSHYHPHSHPHPHNHLPNYPQRFSIDEYQRDSSSGRGSDFSPCMSNDRVFFQTEKTNVEMEVYPDGLARIIDPRITELDFWRDAVLDAL